MSRMRKTAAIAMLIGLAVVLGAAGTGQAAVVLNEPQFTTWSSSLTMGGSPSYENITPDAGTASSTYGAATGGFVMGGGNQTVTITGTAEGEAAGGYNGEELWVWHRSLSQADASEMLGWAGQPTTLHITGTVERTGVDGTAWISVMRNSSQVAYIRIPDTEEQSDTAFDITLSLPGIADTASVEAFAGWMHDTASPSPLNEGTFAGTASYALTITVVPEPASLSLLALGGLAFLRRRSQRRRDA